MAWLEIVFHVVKHGDFGDGLHLNVCLTPFKTNSDLKKIAEKLPANAKYSSPDIQIEVIQVLQRILKKKIITEFKESEVFTVMVDGSTDKNRREIVGIVVRYVTASGEKTKHALDLKHIEYHSAKSLLEILLQSLKEEGIDLERITAQCYNGANVMSG